MSIQVLYIDAEVAEEIEMENFDAQACLDYLAGQDDNEDWEVNDDQVIAGMHFIQIIDSVVGQSVKFIFKGE